MSAVRSVRTPARPAARPTGTTAGAAVVWAVAGLCSFVAEAVSADATRRYSYLTNYVSDLGVPRAETLHHRAPISPLAQVMNVGFLLEGVLFLLAACCAAAAWMPPRRRALLVGLALTHTVGTVLVATIHGSPAAERDSSIGWHFLGAGLAIVGGNAVLLLIGRTWRADPRLRVLGRVSTALGVLGLAGLVMVGTSVGTGSAMLLPDGVWERIAIYSILLWVMLAPAAAVLRDRRARRALRARWEPAPGAAPFTVITPRVPAAATR